MHAVAEFQAAFRVKGARRASLNISAASARNAAQGSHESHCALWQDLA